MLRDGRSRGAPGRDRRLLKKEQTESNQALDLDGGATIVAPSSTKVDHSSLAQLVEQAAVNRRVAGSSPAAGAHQDDLAETRGRFVSGVEFPPPRRTTGPGWGHPGPANRCARQRRAHAAVEAAPAQLGGDAAPQVGIPPRGPALPSGGGKSTSDLGFALTGSQVFGNARSASRRTAARQSGRIEGRLAARPPRRYAGATPAGPGSEGRAWPDGRRDRKIRETAAPVDPLWTDCNGLRWLAHPCGPFFVQARTLRKTGPWLSIGDVSSRTARW